MSEMKEEGRLRKTWGDDEFCSGYVTFYFFSGFARGIWKFPDRSPAGDAAAGLGHSHSHSNIGSKPHLQPTPQLMAMSDPKPAERDQSLNPHPHGCWSGL